MIKTTSRRNFLAIAAVASATLAPSTASAKPASDAELIALGCQLDALRQRYASAIALYQPLWEEHRRRLDLRLDADSTDQGGETITHYERIYTEMGMTAMDEAGKHPDNIMNEIDPIAKKIMAIPAATLAGLSVKASLARFAASEKWEQGENDADWGDLCFMKLCDAVIEMTARAAAANLNLAGG